MKKGIEMNAYELCQRNVVTVRRHEELATAAWMMRERNVGCLVVVEPAGTAGGEKPVGMLTDRDIVTQVVARQKDPLTIRIGDIMSRDVATAREDDSVLDLLAAMRRKGVRRMPVISADNRLVGLATIDDVFAVVAEAIDALSGAVAAAWRHERSQPGTTLSRP